MSRWIDLNGLVLGAATASFQIEGGADSRGSTIWDDLCRRPGAIDNGDTGEVAADHYNRWREDVALMKELGLDAYRLSISWARVQPGGDGPLNPEGVQFYRGLLGALRDAGISPWVTLYHWDLPSELEQAGGWPVRATAEAYGRYSRLMAEQLGDLVDGWITLNEPWCTAYLGYASGVHAPGRTDPADAFATVHHLNLGHGLAVQALRDVLGPDVPVGVTLNVHANYPFDRGNPDDVRAAEIIEMIGNRAFLDPMMHGRMPEKLREITAGITDWGFVREGDLEIANQPTDFLGLNYYSTQYLRWNESPDVNRTGGHGESEHSPWPGSDGVEFVPPEPPVTAMGWNIEPHGLTDLLVRLGEEFPGLPLYVTENGAAYDDDPPVASEGGSPRVADPLRQAYVEKHLAAVVDARAAGA
nr:family 1 glycosylhydrolase [Actinomycetales bacterium]